MFEIMNMKQVYVKIGSKSTKVPGIGVGGTTEPQGQWQG